MKPTSTTPALRRVGSIIGRSMVNKHKVINQTGEEEEAEAAPVQADRKVKPKKLEFPVGSIIKGAMAAKMAACLLTAPE